MEFSFSTQVTRYGIFQATLPGPPATATFNPFTDLTLNATFTGAAHPSRSWTVEGFFDGGSYAVRFMPEAEGTFTFRTHSNHAALDGRTGTFQVTAALPGAHGPVRVRDRFHFAHADGTPYYPIGTTAYAWIHQPEILRAQTLQTLQQAPFNKIRFLIFPKWYPFNRDEPDQFPMLRRSDGTFDPSRFDVAFFRRLDTHVEQLADLGIQADIILFHPYDEDHWGFDHLSAEDNQRYLRYVIARLGAYANVWWSMANEWDLVKHRTVAEWEALLNVVAHHDSHRHLCSIHNGDIERLFDHKRPPLTHISVQNPETVRLATWREQFQRPAIDDECEYEGNIEYPWGNITAAELVHRFWVGHISGGYVGHGETYTHPEDLIWWSRGGVLRGESAPRIGFLRQQLETHGPMNPLPFHWMWRRTPAVRQANTFLIYTGRHQPVALTEVTLSALCASADLPASTRFTLTVLDTWNMSETALPGIFSAESSGWRLPGKPYLALRLRPA